MTIERMEPKDLIQQKQVDCPENLRQNPFYGKKYIVLGRIPIEDYSPSFDEDFQYLGAEKKKSLSSLTNYVFVADKPGINTLMKVEEYRKKGKDIQLIPYFKAVEIAKETQKFMLFNDDYKSQFLINKINHILDSIHTSCDTSSFGLYLNDRNYLDRLKYEEEWKEQKKSEFNNQVILAVIVVIVLIITSIFNLWGIFLIIGLFSLFPKQMGKMTGSIIKSFFK